MNKQELLETAFAIGSVLFINFLFHSMFLTGYNWAEIFLLIFNSLLLWGLVKMKTIDKISKVYDRFCINVTKSMAFLWLPIALMIIGSQNEYGVFYYLIALIIFVIREYSIGGGK